MLWLAASCHANGLSNPQADGYNKALYKILVHRSFKKTFARVSYPVLSAFVMGSIKKDSFFDAAYNKYGVRQILVVHRRLFYAFVLASMTLEGKALASLFFTENLCNVHLWRCGSCSTTVSQRKGYSNLCNHVSSKHIDEMKACHEARRKQPQEEFSSIMSDFKTLAVVHSWIECVVLGPQLLVLLRTKRFAGILSIKAFTARP